MHTSATKQQSEKKETKENIPKEVIRISSHDQYKCTQ